MKLLWRNQKWAVVLLPLLLIGLTTARADFSEEDRLKAETLVEKLEGDGFAGREAAAKKLKQLPSTALPWLEEKIEATPVTEIEYRSRLKSIVRSIAQREAELALREGSPVKIDIESAKPEDVLEAINSELEVSLSAVRWKSIWDSDEAKPFSFEGNYWEAVEKMLETFPPKPAPGREDLSKNQRSSRWIQEDFQAATGSPRTSSGILHVRHGRMALENSGGKDFIVLHLIPTVEPRYQADEVALLVKGLKFPDGTLLEPEDKVAGGDPSRYNRTKIYTWIFPVKEGFKMGKTVQIAGTAKLKVRRLKWSEIPLPEEIGEAVVMGRGVSLKTLEREEGKLKIEFEGEGREPDCFDDYELRTKSYQLLDEKGEKLDFSVRSSSSGGGKGWKNSYSGTIKGEPKRIRARLPDEEQELQLKFELKDVPVPGASILVTDDVAAVEVLPGEAGSIEIEIDKEGTVVLNGKPGTLDDLEAGVKEIKEAAGDTKLQVSVKADDRGKTQAFVDVVNALAKFEITEITMTGFKPDAEATTAVEKTAEKIEAELEKKELELELEPPMKAGPVAAGDGIVVSVGKDGSLSLEGKAITRAALEDKLTLIAKVNKNQSVILRGDRETRFDQVVEVLNACQKAGIWNVSFATTAKKKD